MAKAEMAVQRTGRGVPLPTLTQWQGSLSPPLLYWGFLLLLIWTPLAFGAVHPWARSLLEAHIFLLVALWMGGRAGWLGVRARQHGGGTAGGLVTALGIALFGLFVSLLVFQLLPLAPETLKWLSPSTYRLYSQVLPNWPDSHAPLSLHATATRTSMVTCTAHASLFLLVIDTIRTRRQCRFVVRVIVGVAWFMASLGMAQRFSGTTAIYWWREAHYAPDFFGPYINRNHCAAYLVMALLLGLGLLFTQKPRPHAGRSQAYVYDVLRAIEHWIGPRGLWVYALAVIAGALCLSLSRGAMLSLLAGLTLLILLRRPSPLVPSAWRKWGWILAMMVAAGLWVGVGPLLNRLTVDQISGELSPAGRLGLWRATWEMVKAFPIWGIGFAAYPVAFPGYQTADLHGLFLQAHNDLLQLLAETGWVGGSLLVGLLSLLVGDSVRRWRRRHDPLIREMIPAGLSALAAMALHALVDFNFHIPANALLFTVVLALLYAGVRLPHQRKWHSASSEVRGRDKAWRCRAILATCGMVAALWLSYGAAQVVVANLWYPQQRFVSPHHWTRQSSLNLRRDRLLRALRWHPNQDTYWWSLADLEMEAIRQPLPSDDREPRAAMTARLHRAAFWYQRAVQQRPTDPDAHLSRLIALHLRARLSPAQLQPSDPDLSAYAARIATLAPANPDLQYALGVILLAQESAAPRAVMASQQNRPTSSHFFQQAIRLRPRLTKKLYHLLLESLAEADALTRFTLAIPQTAEGLLAAARLMEASSWVRARSLYLASIALAPAKAQAMEGYGDALHRHGAYTAAREIWQQLQADQPHDADIYLKLAETQRRLGDGAGVIRTLRQLVTQFPHQPEYRHQLATAHLHAGRPVAAQVEWKALSRRFPYFVNAYVGLAQAYERQQDYVGSIAMMRKAINLESGSIRFHSHLARLYQELGSPDVALREYQRLEAFHPNNPHVLYQIGEYARQAGDDRSAREYYLRAWRLNPDEATFRRALDHLETRRLNQPRHMPGLLR